jgi:hypothetical protein
VSFTQRASDSGGGVGDPGSVHEEQQAVRVGEFGELGDLVDRIDTAEFGDLADREDPGFDVVLASGQPEQVGDRVRAQFAVIARDVDELCPCEALESPHSSTLMCAPEGVARRIGNVYRGVRFRVFAL